MKSFRDLKPRRALLPVLAAVLAAGCATPPPPASGLSRPPPAPPPAPAAPASARVRSGRLTLDAAVSRAFLFSDLVISLQAAVDVAAQARLAATDPQPPELRLSYARDTASTDRLRTSQETLTPNPASTLTTGDLDDEGNTFQVGVRFFPDNPWTRAARVSAGTAAFYASEAELRAAQWQVSVEVRRLFEELHYLTNDVRVTSGLVRLQQTVLDAVRARADQGQAVAADVMQATRRYLRALADHEQSRQRLTQARGTLAALVNLPADALAVEPPPRRTDPAELPAWAERIELEALQNRGDLVALYWRARAAKALHEEARRGRRPWFRHIEASYTTGDETSTGADLAREQDAFGILTRQETTLVDDATRREEWRLDAAVVLPLPPALDHTPASLLAQYKLADARHVEALRRAGREIRDALEAIRSTREQWRRFEAEMEPVIEEMQRTLADLKDEPDLPPDQAAALRVEILESLRLKLEARSQYHLALINLESVMGTPLPEGPGSPTVASPDP